METTIVRRVLVVPALLLTGSVAGCASAAGRAPSTPRTIAVVAAENQYGSMVRAIGGKHVAVTSLLQNPNADPHEFEASASAAKAVSEAQFVIQNGIGYDAWMDRLLSASPNSKRIVFTVGSALGKSAGANPHIWYDPQGWPKEAAVIAGDLSALAPKDKGYFQTRKTAWLKSLQPVYNEIRQVRALTSGAKVIATEPVYGYMIAALDADSLDDSFQKATMNGTDPSPQSVEEFMTDLKDHKVHTLFYNSQVTDPTTTEMRSVANQSRVPAVGVTETQPPKITFVEWQLSQLEAVRSTWK